MPRTIPICSGICLLLTTAAFGQLPLPKRPTPLQVAGYTVQKQKTWEHRQLPPNSVLFKSNANYVASHTFLNNRHLMDLSHINVPASKEPYGFSIKQAYPLHTDYKGVFTNDNSYELLRLYLESERMYYSSQQSARWTDEDGVGIGAGILRSILGYPALPPPGSYRR